MSALTNLWNDWFLTVICLAVAAVIPVVYLYCKSATQRPVFLDAGVFKELPLIDKKVLSYNTRLFRYRTLFCTLGTVPHHIRLTVFKYVSKNQGTGV